MKQMKVLTSFAKSLEALGDAECGRLFRAMLQYTETGTEPELCGNERYVWPAAKLHLDQIMAEDERKRLSCSINGAKGGRPVKAKKSQEKPDKANESQEKPKKPWLSEKKAPLVPPSASPLEPPITNPPIIPPKKEPPPTPPWGEVPPGPLLDALRDFEQMRVKIRKPMTPRARKLLLGHLRKLSSDEGEQIAILEQSILNGWQDVYALKGGARDGGRQEPAAPNLKLGTHL